MIFVMVDVETIERIVRLEGAIVRIEGSVASLLKVLLGNGQPGRLTSIEARLNELEQFKWKALGVLSAITFLALQIFPLLKYFFKIG